MIEQWQSFIDLSQTGQLCLSMAMPRLCYGLLILIGPMAMPIHTPIAYAYGVWLWVITGVNGNLSVSEGTFQPFFVGIIRPFLKPLNEKRIGTWVSFLLSFASQTRRNGISHGEHNTDTRWAYTTFISRVTLALTWYPRKHFILA